MNPFQAVDDVIDHFDRVSFTDESLAQSARGTGRGIQQSERGLSARIEVIGVRHRPF